MGTVFDLETIQKINLFEKLTKSHVKHCYESKGRLVVIVGPGESRVIIGQNKAGLKKLEEVFKMPLRIIEFNRSMLNFITNMFAPLKVVSITEEDGVVVVTSTDQKTKGLMIGAKGRNLRLTESVVQNFFPDLKEIKIQ